jgi:hypothetical protein
MNSITEREKGLLILAATVLLTVLYFVARIQPQTDESKALAEEVANLETAVKSFTMPRNSGDPEAVKTQLEETQTKLKQAREELDALFRKRVDESSHQALEDLMLEIMKLASAKGVSVDTSGVYAGSSADFGILSKEELSGLQAGGEPFRFRPLRSLTLRGGYPHIQDFIEGLPELKHEVNVLRFSIKPVLSLSKGADGDKQAAKAGGQPSGLRAELVLAL